MRSALVHAGALSSRGERHVAIESACCSRRGSSRFSRPRSSRAVSLCGPAHCCLSNAVASRPRDRRRRFLLFRRRRRGTRFSRGLDAARELSLARPAQGAPRRPPGLDVDRRAMTEAERDALVEGVHLGAVSRFGAVKLSALRLDERAPLPPWLERARVDRRRRHAHAARGAEAPRRHRAAARASGGVPVRAIGGDDDRRIATRHDRDPAASSARSRRERARSSPTSNPRTPRGSSRSR